MVRVVGLPPRSRRSPTDSKDAVRRMKLVGVFDVRFRVLARVKRIAAHAVTSGSVNSIETFA